MPDEHLPSRASSALLPLPGIEAIPIYTHSWLGYGLDTAFAKASRITQANWVANASAGSQAPDPCLPTG